MIHHPIKQAQHVAKVLASGWLWMDSILYAVPFINELLWKLEDLRIKKYMRNQKWFREQQI